MKLTKSIILASGSPRRADLLHELGLSFTQLSPDVDEVIPAGMVPEEVPVYLAELKASAVERELTDTTVVLTADTIVLCEGRILGKPRDEAEALEMLTLLCGNTHHVITGYCIKMLAEHNQPVKRSNAVRTAVTLHTATTEEISRYIQDSIVLDKAGSYGIQDWLGWAKVTHLSGSYSNVMGLPTAHVYKDLVDLGILHVS